MARLWIGLRIHGLMGMPTVRWKPSDAGEKFFEGTSVGIAFDRRLAKIHTGWEAEGDRGKWLFGVGERHQMGCTARPPRGGQWMSEVQSTDYVWAYSWRRVIVGSSSGGWDFAWGSMQPHGRPVRARRMGKEEGGRIGSLGEELSMERERREGCQRTSSLEPGFLQLEAERFDRLQSSFLGETDGTGRGEAMGDEAVESQEAASGCSLLTDHTRREKFVL